MANRWSDLIGTVKSSFLIGLGATQVRLKNLAGVLQIKNRADDAFIPLIASLLGVDGNDIELNSNSTSTGANWKYTLRRPPTGMSEARIIILPSGNPTVGQALVIDSYNSGTGIIELGYATIAGGADKLIVDTTTVAFGSSSPVAMTTIQIGAVVEKVQVIVDTPFDGTPTMSIGITGTTSKYMGTGDMDLTVAGVYEVSPGVVAVSGSPENLIATYSAGGATVGSARVLLSHMIPS